MANFIIVLWFPMLAWLDEKSPDEEQVETAFKAMVRYMNVLAESQAEGTPTGGRLDWLPPTKSEGESA